MGRVLVKGIAIDYIAGSPNTLRKAEMRVLDPSGAAVVLYSAETGEGTENNPFRADNDGNFQFYIEDTIRFVDVVFFNGRNAPTQRFAVNAGVTSVSIAELQSDITELARFVGYDLGNGGTPATGTPNASANFVGTPSAAGIDWTWDLAADNGSGLTRQVFTYISDGIEISVPMNALRTSYTTPALPGETITPTIIAFNGLGDGDPATAAPVTAWRLPNPVTGVTALPLQPDLAEVNFTPAAVLDVADTEYRYRIVRTFGDGDEETGTVLAGDPLFIRTENMQTGEVRQLYITTVNPAGESTEAGPFDMAALNIVVPLPIITFEQIAGGIRLTNPGWSTNGGEDPFETEVLIRETV